MYQFNRGQELLALCRQHDLGISDILIRSEEEETGRSVQEIKNAMAENYIIMKESVEKGLDPDIKSVGGLIGGNAARLYKRLKGSNFCGPMLIKAVSYALAVTEVNAAMGRIVAAPTAGASGIVPGIIIALAEEQSLSDQQAVEALFVAGAVGKIIAINATLSGAEGGCQAEVGSASAMAASAAVFLGGGTSEQCLNGAAMALKGLLGLVCDPVAGLVEVPCSKRNATGTANALICAELALAGVNSFLPFDEVVGAMYRVGRLLSPDLRETAGGGCALTPTAVEFSRNILGAVE